MTEDEQLKNCFENLKKKDSQAQLRWCTVISVDKENRLMDAMGETDGLEYYDIQLGMGSFNFYPKPGTICLVALIEGRETDAYLLSAAEVESVELTAGTIILNEGEQGGVVKVSELVDRLNLIEKNINSLKQKMLGWVPVPNDGGAALKTAIASCLSDVLKETRVEDIVNEKVRQ